MDATSAVASSEAIALNMPVYEHYKDAGGQVPVLCLVASVYGLIALAGGAMNLSLGFITFKEKSLRGTTNYLIAVTGLFEAMHQLFGHIPFAVVALSGLNFVPFETVFPSQVIAMFGVDAAMAAMFSTALDRLICVFAPLRYKAMNRRRFLAVNILLDCVCGLGGVALGFPCFWANRKALVIGWLGDMGDYTLDALAICSIMSIGAAICYLAIWIRLRALEGGGPSNQPQQQQQTQSFDKNVFKSLFSIIAVVLGGYLICGCTFFALNWFSAANPLLDWYIFVGSGTCLNIGAASSAPILFAFSSDYRKALRKHLLKPLLGHFERLFCCRKTEPNVNGAMHHQNIVVGFTVHQIPQSHQQPINSSAVGIKTGREIHNNNNNNNIPNTVYFHRSSQNF